MSELDVEISVQTDILELNIAVAEIFPMDVLQPFTDLTDEESGCILAQRDISHLLF